MESLRKINDLLGNANPDDYESISYNKYLRDLTNISNIIINETKDQKEKNISLLKAINSLSDNREKEILLNILLN